MYLEIAYLSETKTATWDATIASNLRFKKQKKKKTINIAFMYVISSRLEDHVLCFSFHRFKEHGWQITLSKAWEDHLFRYSMSVLVLEYGTYSNPN